jgi:chromosome segregation ATPase
MIVGFINLIPRWALLAALVAALAGAAWQTVKLASARSDLLTAERQIADMRTAIAVANTEAANKTAALQSFVTKAQNEAKKRENDLRAAAAGAQSESDSLRNDLNTLRQQLATASSDARAERASAIAAVLAQCSARYQMLAERCDRHVNDLRTMTEAWPK